MSGYDAKHIINTDQSGFSYEYVSKRTLENIGNKHVLVSAQSVHATTHSYTIQPMLNMNGELLGKLMIILQEPDGEFGPRVQKDINQYLPPNVVVTCSKSGKSNNKIIKQFLIECLKPVSSDNFILMQDSWSAHNDVAEIEDIFGDKCTLLVIPEGTTDHIQPLAVY
ncbi:uncharacterized protein B4U80_00183, partial [Leptotrombidium deliense]